MKFDVKRRARRALVVLLMPLAACELPGVLSPEPEADPLAGALTGETTPFEGEVAAVDLERSALVFSNGVRVEVGVDTDISAEHEIGSLAAAAAWLDEGFELVAWGEGVVASEDPPVIEAATLTIRTGTLEDSEDGEGEEEAALVEYEGVILAVDVEAGTVSLDREGAVIRVTDATEISDDFGIASLAAAKERVEAGDTLFAWGKGTVESEDPLVLEATRLVMKVRSEAEPDPEEEEEEGEGEGHVEWEGVVASIDLEAGTLSLEGGKTIRVIGETEISDDFGLASLASAAEALAGGTGVVAWGVGEVESEDPVVIVALSLVMKPAS